MAILNFILQGKGGVGKSTIASFLTQHYLQGGITPVCYDTDPVNPTFSSYKALGAKHVDILNGDTVNTRSFDAMMEELLGLGSDDVAIIDNGSTSFIPLCAYMIETNVVPFVIEQGHSFVIHTVIAGSQGYVETIKGAVALMDHFPDAKFVLWKNEHFGALESKGKSFEQTKYYQDRKDQIVNSVRLKEVKRETVGRDLDELFLRHKTFAEGLEDPDISIMARQRLKTHWQNIDAAITAGGL